MQICTENDVVRALLAQNHNTCQCLPQRDRHEQESCVLWLQMPRALPKSRLLQYIWLCAADASSLAQAQTFAILWAVCCRCLKPCPGSIFAVHWVMKNTTLTCMLGKYHDRSQWVDCCQDNGGLVNRRLFQQPMRRLGLVEGDTWVVGERLSSIGVVWKVAPHSRRLLG